MHAMSKRSAVMQGNATTTSLFAYPQYPAWLSADTALAAGLALRTLALSLLGFALTGSTLQAGWLATGSMIVGLIAQVFGGTLVDRVNRVFCIALNAGIGIGIWTLVALLSALNMLPFSVLMTLACIAAGVHGLFGTATDAMLRSIVPIEAYPRARSLNEGRDATVSMLGGPVSGMLYSMAPWVPFASSAVLYALAAISCFPLRAQSHSLHSETVTEQNDSDEIHAKTEVSHHTSFIHDMVEGWQWSLTKPRVVLIVSIAAFANFGINGVQYAIELDFVAQGISATRIGYISGTIALAMLVGSLIAGKLSTRVHVGAAACISLIWIAVCGLLLVSVHQYWLILLVNAGLGLPIAMMNATLLGFVFAKAPHHMQGRVTVTLTMPAQILSATCGALAGWLLAVASYTVAISVFATVLCCAAVLAISARMIRNIPNAQQWRTVAL